MKNDRQPETVTPTRRRKPRLFSVASLAVIAFLLLAASAGQAAGNNGQNELAPIRRATAKYHNLDVALADGYQLGYRGIITGCIQHPTDGAMGYHYFNWDLIDDLEVDTLRPEGLVYAPAANGKLKLAAVEWVVPQQRDDRPGVTEAPTVPGINLELHILNPALGWYIGHAWIWDPNPSGMFSDWNPDVICP